MTEDPIIQKPVDYSLDDRDFCHERVKKKPDLFNLFFAKRCTLADNASTLPIGSVLALSARVHRLAKNRLKRSGFFFTLS